MGVADTVMDTDMGCGGVLDEDEDGLDESPGGE
jgi:hypothetical protein